MEIKELKVVLEAQKERRKIHGVCFFIARVHFSRRNFEKALKNIKEVVELYPKF